MNVLNKCLELREICLKSEIKNKTKIKAGASEVAHGVKVLAAIC